MFHARTNDALAYQVGRSGGCWMRSLIRAGLTFFFFFFVGAVRASVAAPKIESNTFRREDAVASERERERERERPRVIPKMKTSHTQIYVWTCVRACVRVHVPQIYIYVYMFSADVDWPRRRRRRQQQPPHLDASRSYHIAFAFILKSNSHRRRHRPPKTSARSGDDDDAKRIPYRVPSKSQINTQPSARVCC